MDGSAGRGANAPKLCIECARQAVRDSAHWTPDTIVAAIREWMAEYGAPPGAADWNPWNGGATSKAERAARFYATPGRWPHVSTVQRVFGSWNDGLRAAGITPLPAGMTGRRAGEDPEVVAETARLYLEGWSARDVGLRMECSQTAVLYRLRRAGVPIRASARNSAAIVREALTHA